MTDSGQSGGMPRAKARKDPGWFAACEQADDMLGEMHAFYGLQKDTLLEAWSDEGALIEQVKEALMPYLPQDAFSRSEVMSLLNPDNILRELRLCGKDVATTVRNIRCDMATKAEYAHARSLQMAVAFSVPKVAKTVKSVAPFAFSYHSGTSQKPYSDDDILHVEKQLIRLEHKLIECRDMTLERLRDEFGFHPDGDSWRMDLEGGEGRHVNIKAESIRLATVQRWPEGEGEYLQFSWRGEPRVEDNRILFREESQRFSKQSGFVRKWGNDADAMSKALQGMSHSAVKELAETERRQLEQEQKEQEQQRNDLLVAKAEQERLRQWDMANVDDEELGGFSSFAPHMLPLGQRRQASPAMALG